MQIDEVIEWLVRLFEGCIHWFDGQRECGCVFDRKQSLCERFEGIFLQFE
jgi:hypothetical protein